MKDYGYRKKKILKKNERLSKGETWDFWKNTEKDSKTNNSPNSYIEGIERSAYLSTLIKKYLSKKSKILEIGCNVGRNLNYLYEKNYNNLNGIEINENAIKLMRKTYPELYKNSHIHIGATENLIGKFKTDSFDLIYTMAVLEHIHWDSEFIFESIKKISSKYIITIEDEFTSWSDRHFPRNYQKVFEDDNWKQIFTTNCSPIKILDDRFMVRVFKKNN